MKKVKKDYIENARMQLVYYEFGQGFFRTLINIITGRE